MAITLMDARPPVVRFEQRTEEDREASIKAGGPMTRDVNFAIIRQSGSRDSVEMKAEDFLAQYRAHAANGLIPATWVEHFSTEYERWKSGMDVSEFGCSVRNWPGVSKAQVENLIALGVRTIEDVAAMNEPTMNRLGLGARELKHKAAAYLEGRDANKSVEMIAALQAETANKDVRIASLEAAIAELTARIESIQPTKKRA